LLRVGACKAWLENRLGSTEVIGECLIGKHVCVPPF
jgi:hypothetical protein